MDDATTCTALIPPDTASATRLVERAAAYAKTSHSENTIRAYESDLRTFREWAATNGFPSLPTSEEIVSCYVAHLADSGKKSATICRAVSAIISEHKAAGHDTPTGKILTETLSGVRRTLGTAPRQKAPVLAADLKKMIEITGDDLVGCRDRLLLVMGFCGAFRRSELVALDVSDVVVVRGGLEVTLRRSKTDQEGQGRVVALPRSSDSSLCPEALLKQWLEVVEVATGAPPQGPLFRSIVSHYGRILGLSEKGLCADTVAKIVKGLARQAGLANAEEISGHSLRAGLVTEAALAGRTAISIQRTTGHKSSRMVDRYIRSSDMWRDNAAKGLL